MGTIRNIILTSQITERQRDSKACEDKYVITGITLDGSQAQAVTKIGFTGKLIVITFYVL